MMKNFTAFVKKTDDGWYAVSCLEVQGAFSQGKTKKEALINIKDAIKELLSYRREKMSRMPFEETSLSLAI